MRRWGDACSCHLCWCVLVGYTMDTMYFGQLPGPVDVDKDVQMPQFKLIKENVSDCSQNYTTGAYNQWRKVVRMVRVSQVKPSNCFRRLEKLVLPSLFDTNLSSFTVCRVIQQFRMKECGILGGQNVLSPFYIFSGASGPPPHDVRLRI